MPNQKLVRLARRWKPDQADPNGSDKKSLIDFCLNNGITSANPKTVGWLASNVPFSRTYTPNQLQQQVIVPLRNEPTVFIGTGGAGLFLVTSPEDADQTLGFYTTRVRAEQRHSRNLRSLAKRTGLFDGHTSTIAAGKARAVIFIDESGTPAVTDLNPPVFVVAAVLIESMQELAQLEQRFRNACSIIGRPVEHELRTGGLSAPKHRQVLRELSLIDYQWAAACFSKRDLTGQGFADPKTFYRYAFQFLIGDLLAIGWRSDLVIDEYSTDAFRDEMKAYLLRQNSGLPINRLNEISFAQSSKQRLVQLADLVAGAVRRSTQGEDGPLTQIDEKRINLQFWPPRR